ncbi:hypothetical protein Tco_0781667 [Tanacetum coccineum]
MRDVEWEPIEEERLEEPKEGWMLGESKKRSIRISSRMLIVGLVPQSRVTLVKARSNPSEAQHKFISSVISTRRCRCRMRELVVKYKAEKVCHEEMVKMPLVDLKVLEDALWTLSTRSLEGDESIWEDEFEAAEEREEKCHVKAFTRSDNRSVVEQGLGCLLRRREKVIAYTTRQLEIHVKNDTTHVMELGVMVKRIENKAKTGIYGFVAIKSAYYSKSRQSREKSPSTPMERAWKNESSGAL